MKKLKVLKGALIGVFVVAAACCIFTACSSDKDSADNTPITDMTLSVDNVKRTYLTYQSFSFDGIEATVKHESGNSEAIVANDLVVDYSAFDNSTAGEYDIVVSYTENGITLSDSYTVEVIEEITGLAIEKDVIDYTVESASGVDIDVSDVRVYTVDGNGRSSSVLSSGSYELKFFKNGDELSSLNGVSAGIYTIYAYRNVTISGKYSTIDYECGAYVIVYVVDSLEKIELNGATATLEQDLGSVDIMSPTWTFTLTYSSGVTVQLTIDDVDVAGLNTKVPAAEGATATITYSETSVTSTKRETQTVSTTVTYVIIAAEGQTVLEYEYSYNELLEASGVDADTKMQSEWFTGNNAFLSFVGTHDDNVIRPSNNVIQIRGEAFQVTFAGTGEIEIGFNSTGSGNTSDLGLKNEAGEYVQGVPQSPSDNGPTEVQLTDTDGNVTGYLYEMKGTSEGKVLFTINTPGTYTIVGRINTTSNVRIRSIKMTDIYDSSSSVAASLATEAVLEMGGGLVLSEFLSLENIDLSLPQSATVTMGVRDCEKN